MHRFPLLTRRWLQFSVRTLLVATTVLAAVLAYHVKWKHERRKFLDDCWYARIEDRFSFPPDVPLGLWLVGERDPVQRLRMDKLDARQRAEAQRLFPEAFPQG